MITYMYLVYVSLYQTAELFWEDKENQSLHSLQTWYQSNIMSSVQNTADSYIQMKYYLQETAYLLIHFN